MERDQRDSLILYTSSGILRYSENPYKAVLEIDQGIVDYYRWFIPRSISLNRQKYRAHISVVRNENDFNKELWGKYEGKEIEFQYSNVICSGYVYYWINAYSDELSRIRLELGLSEDTNLPEFERCFHITLGNIKD
jgi:hypothetical protein